MVADPSAGIMSHAIQLAIAPVFLLTGIAGLLAVIANRLGRIIDRARSLEQIRLSMDAEERAAAHAELGMLERRRHVCSWSINFCTAGALLVCLVIISLFVDEFVGLNLTPLTGTLFVVSMIGVIGGLTCFLREVYLATHTTAINAKRFE